MPFTVDIKDVSSVQKYATDRSYLGIAITVVIAIIILIVAFFMNIVKWILLFIAILLFITVGVRVYLKVKETKRN